MSSYTPDYWVLVEFKSEKFGTIRKILATWDGGFGGTDYWKLSSGNLPEHMEDGFIVFPQESGSVYYCHPDAQRSNSYMRDIFSQIDNSIKPAGASIEIIKYTIPNQVT